MNANKRLYIALILLISCSLSAAQSFDHFITCKGDQLMDGDQVYRFISFNIPNLHYVEDDMMFEESNPFRFPTEYEIEDALLSISQMGGQVTRIYTLPVRSKNDPVELPKYVEAPGKFNEDAFKTLDMVLAKANKIGVRVIIPFVDNWHWWGGTAEYAAFRDKKKEAFWNDPQVIDDFKKTIEFVINRRNTITGQLYKDDKAILCWETGNELQCTHEWTTQIAKYIKSLDSNHLVLDGYFTSVLQDESLNNPYIDLVSTHHYESKIEDMQSHILISQQKAKGKKPYFLGEFGFKPTGALLSVVDMAIENNLTGALIWSLRCHHKDGGYFWHYEPAGGDFFRSYHWPGAPTGIAYDEENLMQLYRNRAYQIQGKTAPVVDRPKPPTLLPIENVSSIRWQSVTGATNYQLERAESKSGPWLVLADKISDAKYPYRPQFVDTSAEIGKSYFYRVRSSNASGLSIPGNIIGPVTANSLVYLDEFENTSRYFKAYGKMSIRQNEARRFKEDLHRMDVTASSGIIYYLSNPIQSMTLDAFLEKDQENLITVSTSSDGKNYTAIDVSKKTYPYGNNAYNYALPVRYTIDNSPAKMHYLKIDFKAPMSLSRLEIEYGQ